MRVTRRNYFSVKANMEYMGATQFKDFCKCEAMALAKAKGEYIPSSTTALLQGSYMDAYFENDIEKFREEHPEMFKKNGELLACYKDVEDIIEFVKQDEVFMKHCIGKQQKVMTGEINGVKFKILIDSMLPDMTVDRKLIKDFEDIYDKNAGMRKVFWDYWGYDKQGAIYQAIRSQNENLKMKPFVLACVTKEKQPNKELIWFDQDILDYTLNEIIIPQAPRFDAIKKGIIEPTSCGVCEYCLSKKKMQQGIYKKASEFIDDGGFADLEPVEEDIE